MMKNLISETFRVWKVSKVSKPDLKHIALLEYLKIMKGYTSG